MIERGDWQVSQVARNAFDLEGKVVGTIGAGRIGYRVLQRLKPFDCKELLYYDYAALPESMSPMIWYTYSDIILIGILQRLPRKLVAVAWRI